VSGPPVEVPAGAAGVSFAFARRAGRWGWKLGAVTRATSLEAAGADGSGAASFEGEKRTTGAVATSASAPVTANRPITGTTARVQRLLMTPLPLRHPVAAS